MLCSLHRSCLVHRRSCWQWRVVQLWPGDFLTVFRVFLVKKHAAFEWKDAISAFPVSPGSAEALVKCGGKIKYILIACFLGNICAKNCRNRTVFVKIIASCNGGAFFWDSVYIQPASLLQECIMVRDGLARLPDAFTAGDMSDIVRYLCMCWLFCLSVCLFIFSLFLFFIFCVYSVYDWYNK